MLETKIRKGTFQHVESELYAYHDTKKEIMRLRNDIIYSSSPPNESGIRGSMPSNPTESTVTALTTDRRITHLEKTVEAIEGVYNRLPEDKQRLIKLKYWTRPQMLTWEGIAEKLYVSRRQAINWRDEVVFAIADHFGWK